MTEVSNRSKLDNLRREVGRIGDGHGSFIDITKGEEFKDYRPFEPAPADTRLRPMGRTKDTTGKEPFGRWLLAQKDRGDWIDPIAAAARRDPAFPKDGDPDAVRKRMSEQGADPEMFEALDDAELHWSSQ